MQRSVARNHHYVPQAYLGLFTDTGDKSGHLHAIPTTGKAPFKTSPRNVAAERDFNRVDVDGYPPDHIEASLAPIEGNAVQAIRDMTGSLALPTDRGYSYLLNLVCLLFVRNPARRRAINAARERVLRGELRMLVRSPESWAQYMKIVRERDPELPSVPFEKANDFIANDKYRLAFMPEASVRKEFEAFDSVLQLFASRTWSVLVAPTDGSRFVSSDNPVSLTATRPSSAKVTLDTPSTEIFFPLAPDLGLVGVLDERLPPTIHLKADAVGIMNRRTARNAYRYIFSREDTFTITNRAGVHAMRIS